MIRQHFGVKLLRLLRQAITAVAALPKEEEMLTNHVSTVYTHVGTARHKNKLKSHKSYYVIKQCAAHFSLS